MSSVLSKIAAQTSQRVAAKQAEYPLERLQAEALLARKPHDFRTIFLQPGFQVIAEIKFASPSQGKIASGSPVAVAQAYLSHGAAALSVLTEPDFFQGQLEYLSAVRQAFPEARLLMKDFMLSPYQLYQARIAGADAMFLLIVALLADAELKELYTCALALGLTPLVEVHDAEEMERALALGANLIGVNNRNLKTLQIDLQTSALLAAQAPAETVLICESGLSTAQDLKQAAAWGYRGFLIGTHFMASGDPGPALGLLLAGCNAD